MPLQDSLLEIIKDAPLSETTKNFFQRKVAKEGATSENLAALQELLRAVQEQALQKMAADLGDDPDVKAAMTDMKTKIETASEAYSQSMAKLIKANEQLASDIQEDLKHLEKIVVTSAQAEA